MRRGYQALEEWRHLQEIDGAIHGLRWPKSGKWCQTWARGH